MSSRARRITLLAQLALLGVPAPWLTSATYGATPADFQPPASLEIPFQYINGFIIVAVNIDGVLPTKFIFDTGSQHTLLTDPTLIQLLGRPPDEPIRIVGSDLSVAITGSLLRRTAIQLGNLTLSSQPLILLDADFLNLAELTGESVYGILGIRAFGAYAITIDYQRFVIRLETSVPRRQLQSGVRIPLTLVRGKPYLNVSARVHAGYSDSLSLLIDTGASLGLLIHTGPTDTALYPPRIVLGPVGYGLGGPLLGYVGRSDTLYIGSLALPQVITHFQVTDDDSFLGDVPVRGGLLGNQILDRFLVTFDLPGKMLYLRPMRRYARKQAYDRSGLTLVSGGDKLQYVLVQLVTPGSPAAEAGLRSGDVITHARGLPAGVLGTGRVQRLLRRRIGRHIRLRCQREGVPFRVVLTLRELI